MSTNSAVHLPAGRLRRTALLSTRHRWSVAIVLLLALLFYLWTAATTYPFTFSATDGVSGTDAYNLLTTAFLHGHTYLPLAVPAGLVRLHDPYNPAQNIAYQPYFHDLLLYHRRFYSAWGPSATLLFLIARISTYRLPNSLAVALYCFGGLVGATALLHVLARRFVPAMSDWMLTVATIGLALTNVAPFLLRRPAQYEVAISGAYCFEMIGLYLVVTASLAAPPGLRRLALGSLSLGLALLARPTMAVDLLVLVVVVVFLMRKGGSRWRVATCSLGPFVLCIIALVAYNEVRFGGGPTDFGTQYQLAGLEQLHKPTDQLSYIPPGLFNYLFIPAQLSLGFPHVFLQTTAQYPFRLPAGYAGTPGGGGAEVAGGLLPTMPITVLLLGLPIAWWRRRSGERVALLLIGGATALSLAVMVLLAYAFWLATQRYEVDYASLALIPAFLLWGLLMARLRPGSWARRSLGTTGVVLTALGAGAGVAVSFTGYLNLLQLEHPSTYNDLEDVTAPLVTAATMITGRPALVQVIGPEPVTPPGGSPYTQFDAVGSSTYVGGYPVSVTIVSPRRESAGLAALASPGSAPLKGQVISVVSSGSPAESVPILSPSLRIPIVLHRGLNRITLQSEGATITQLEQTFLSGLHITS